MPTRSRSQGARVPVTGFLAAAANTCVITGTFKSPKDGANRNAGIYALSGAYGGFTDSRESIQDSTGNRTGVNTVSHGKTVIKCDISATTFTQRNPTSPSGRAVTTLGSSVVPYYLDQRMLNPHASVPDGAAIALARVPNMSPELLSGLNSLYELKDTKAFVDLIPVHFLWAAARRKRAESRRELHKWLRHIKDTARSPLGVIQACVGADLMWKFGVAPLVRDVHNVHTALANMERKMGELAGKPFTLAGRFMQSKTEKYDNVTGNSPDTHGYYSRVVSTHATTMKTWVYGVRKRVDISKLPSINVSRLTSVAESLGLGLDATDLWEAVPYSFVIDWFLPIQTFLEQFAATKPDPSWLLTTEAWTSTKTVTQGRVHEVTNPLTTSNCVVEGSSGLIRWGDFTRTDYTRTKLSSLPTWNPGVYIPSWKAPNLAQSWTGMELLIQRIKRTLK